MDPAYSTDDFAQVSLCFRRRAWGRRSAWRRRLGWPTIPERWPKGPSGCFQFVWGVPMFLESLHGGCQYVGSILSAPDFWKQPTRGYQAGLFGLMELMALFLSDDLTPNKSSAPRTFKSEAA